VDLLDAFEARLGTEVPPAERGQVAASLAELVRRGRAAWPELAVAERDVCETAADRIRGAVRIADELDALPAADLHLATACAAGNPTAIERFEDRYFRAARDALRRMGRDAAAADDILQRVRERLFVAAPGEAPRIRTLAGGGDLGALVRIAAVRLALNAQRDDHRDGGDPEPLLAQLALGSDPEAEVIAEHTRAEVERAFTDALATLAPRDRTLLRLHLVHDLSIDEIGATFRVHRSTAARWLARIRSELEDGTLSRLQDRLGAGDTEAASLIRLVRSRLDVSFSRILASR
jgi:RNA polymerase sigma-70 factor (ECF subfamily)